jgi:thiosulfate dehydrogenase [quinone] large subunit
MHKVQNPAWVRHRRSASRASGPGAVAIPETGRPPITFDWYRSFLQTLLDAQAYTWFAKLVAYGELLVGIALILGAFTGIAAFFGGMMNFNFMLAGSASTNPLLFVIAVGLILAWKVAGYFGADYFLLRWIGTPWHGKPAEDKVTVPATAAAAASTAITAYWQQNAGPLIERPGLIRRCDWRRAGKTDKCQQRAATEDTTFTRGQRLD